MGPPPGIRLFTLGCLCVYDNKVDHFKKCNTWKGVASTFSNAAQPLWCIDAGFLGCHYFCTIWAACLIYPDLWMGWGFFGRGGLLFLDVTVKCLSFTRWLFELVCDWISFFYSVLHSLLIYSTVLQFTLLHSIPFYCTLLYSPAFYSPLLFSTSLHSIPLRSIPRHSILQIDKQSSTEWSIAQTRVKSNETEDSRTEWSRREWTGIERNGVK